jgi:hypothetical protein
MTSFTPYTDRRLTVAEKLADAAAYFTGIIDTGYCLDAPELIPAGASFGRALPICLLRGQP